MSGDGSQPDPRSSLKGSAAVFMWKIWATQPLMKPLLCLPLLVGLDRISGDGVDRFFPGGQGGSHYLRWAPRRAEGIRLPVS